MSLIAVNFWKPLHSNWTAGVLRPEAPYLVKIDGFENERKKVQQISTECGFDFAHHGYRIATDEMTYLSLHHKSIAPLNVFFIKSKFRLKGESITDALKRVSSSGLIAKLTSLEAADRKSCRILDEYCCIGPLA